MRAPGTIKRIWGVPPGWGRHSQNFDGDGGQFRGVALPPSTTATAAAFALAWTTNDFN